MAAVDFPNSPTVGAVYTSAGLSWQWDGVKWAPYSTAPVWSNDAPSDTFLYERRSAGWVRDPIQADAPDSSLYARQQGVWTRNPIQADAPDSNYYLRQNGVWTPTAVAMNDNRIINGDMRIDQRWNGSSGTGVSVYTIDRWQYGSTAGLVTWGRNLNANAGPPGFPYYLGFQSSSAHSSASSDSALLQQTIEADFVGDLGQGTANAQPFTVSFWVYSSLTGTFGASVDNVGTGTNRSYPFSFAIPTANTWTKIAVTIPGDTGGTWVRTGNAGGLRLSFDLGCGSSYNGPANAWGAGFFSGPSGTVKVVSTAGATFYVTGCKLEIGSTATPYNRQSLAKSLADCQRYYQKIGGNGSADVILEGYVSAANQHVTSTIGIQAMRANPAITTVGTFAATNVSGVTFQPGLCSFGVQVAGAAAGYVSWFANSSSTYLTLNAEL